MLKRNLQIDKYELREDWEGGLVSLDCEVHHKNSGEKNTICGEGVGVVHAFYNGFIDLYSESFPSLKTIEFADFQIKALIESRSKGGVKADSPCEAELRINNYSGKEFIFSSQSKSVTRCTIQAVLDAVEFFVNSERAFVAVFNALEYAKTNNRTDSIGLYTSQLAILVEATSYSEVIEKLRLELENID